MKKLKKLLVMVLTIILLFGFGTNVDALSIKLGDSFYMGNYGLTASNGKSYLTYVKTLSGEYAYCTELKLVVNKNGNYKSYSISANHAHVAAQIIDNIKAKGYSSKKEYAYIQAALNTYFYKYVGGIFKSNSANYKNSVVTEAISDARTTVGSITTTLKSGNFSVSDNEMNLASSSSSSSFISNKITLNNLQTDFNGTKPNYTITVTSTEGTPVICSSTSKCTNSNTYTISNGATSYSFYVKVTGATNSGTVSVKVNGTATKTYPSSSAYYVSKGYQVVLKYDEGGWNLNTKSSTSTTLTIPSTTHHIITIYKVDENGDALSGADLKLYTANANGGYDEITDFKADSNGTVFRYSSPIVTTGDDDFYNKEFYFQEVKAPDGFIFGDSEKAMSQALPITKEKSTLCYNAEGETVDIGYCQSENYTLACQDSDGVISDYTEGGCGVSTDVGDTGDSTDSDENQGSESGDSTDTESGTEGTTEDTPKEYKTICIKISSNEVVNDDYCNDNQTYIKVTNSGSNVTFIKYNQRNNLKISKQDITSHEEVSGAVLKICKASDYDSKGNDCEAATTIDDVSMSWKSGTSPAVWSGVPAGDYYIVEVTPPSGYQITTIATAFNVATDGTVTSGGTEVTDNTVVVNNKLTHIDIDKVSAEDNKTLSGATLAICASTQNEDGTYEILKDREGNYLVMTLFDESEAQWQTDGNTKGIDGLPAGTYFLVEMVAPNGYSESTPIQFTLSDNGILYDADGKQIENNKLIVKDYVLINQPTGSSIILLACVMAIAGFGIYYYKKNRLVGDKTAKK